MVKRKLYKEHRTNGLVTKKQTDNGYKKEKPGHPMCCYCPSREIVSTIIPPFPTIGLRKNHGRLVIGRRGYIHINLKDFTT